MGINTDDYTERYSLPIGSLTDRTIANSKSLHNYEMDKWQRIENIEVEENWWQGSGEPKIVRGSWLCES